MTNLLKSVKNTATINLPFIARGSIINSIQFATDGGGDILKIKYRDGREVWVWADDGVNVFCDTESGIQDMLEGVTPKQAVVFHKDGRKSSLYGKQGVAGHSYVRLNRRPNYHYNEQRIISGERDYNWVTVQHGYNNDTVAVSVKDGRSGEFIAIDIKYLHDSDVITVNDGKMIVIFKADGAKRFKLI